MILVWNLDLSMILTARVVLLFILGKFGNENELKILRTKKVKTMSVSTASGYHLEDLGDEVAIQLMNSIDCVSR